MKFFGRELELKELRKVRDVSFERSRFTVLTGRRRVGKTELSREAFDDGKTPYVNLPITRQPEVTLCAQLQEEAERVLHIGIHGTCTRFGDLFRELMKEAEKRPFTLVLDEFQEFDRTNPGVYGDIQHIWDEYHNKTKLNLVVNGSINRLMNKIFCDDSQPLYGRNTGTLTLKPFSTALLKEIFRFYKPDYTNRDLLALWTVSGGVARYVDLMMSARAFTKEAMLEEVFSMLSRRGLLDAFRVHPGRTNHPRGGIRSRLRHVFHLACGDFLWADNLRRVEKSSWCGGRRLSRQVGGTVFHCSQEAADL